MTSLSLRSRDSRRWRALVCLSLFLTLQLFSASGTLHQALHPDAAAPGHHCVFTLFAQGQWHAPDSTGVLAAFAAVLIFCLPPLRAAVLAAPDRRLSPSRAPPRS